ncbi:unnamed protein product [Caenorhabditis auriculariae]|uniref:Uncharacterized protein n=1 Tax=Caenorhabditis auriculariae TaxID=2777116 RepID=A0A8S1H3T1_9PELO|nr:unnamed protein product [Caenorhabditis auriculariae]
MSSTTTPVEALARLCFAPRKPRVQKAFAKIKNRAVRKLINDDIEANKSPEKPFQGFAKLSASTESLENGSNTDSDEEKAEKIDSKPKNQTLIPQK